MKHLPFISLFFVALLATSSFASANYVTSEKPIVTEVMQNYDLNGQNNSLQLACEIGQYVSDEYGWNCDIRELKFTKHAPVYINVFYPAADNKKGYEAYYGWFGPQKKEVTGFTGKDKRMYYRNWYEGTGECSISGVCSYGTIKSYFGNTTEEVIEENTTDPIIIVTPNETIEPEDSKPIKTEEVEVYNNSFAGNQTQDNNISATNTTGVIVANGLENKISKIIFDWTNVNLSNVNFNFWSN